MDLLVELSDDESSPGSREQDFHAVTKRLEDAVRHARITAYLIFFCAGVFAFVAVGFVLPHLNQVAVDQITDNINSLYVFVYELLRTTAGAAVVGAILWGLFNLAKASLDQATRFEKRLIAAHFLHYTLDTYKPQIQRGDIALGDVMHFLKAWSENVESAYTKVKFGTKGAEQFAMTVTPSGVSFVNGRDMTVPKPVGKHSDPMEV